MKMFKKTLIAASVAGITTAAVAGSIAESVTTLSLEGAVAEGTVQIGNTTSSGGVGAVTGALDLIVTTGSSYAVNDVIEIRLNGADVVADANSGNPSIEVVDSGATTINDAATYLTPAADQDSNLLRFRADKEIEAKSTITLNNVDLDTSELTNGAKITATANAVSVNQSIGAFDASKSTAIAEAKAQFALDTSDGSNLDLFDGVIDVEQSRQGFTSGSDDTDYDQVRVVLSNNANTFAYTPEEAVHTITGSAGFSYFTAFDANEDGELSQSELASAVSSSTSDDLEYELSADMMTLTITQTNTGGISEDISLNFNAPGTVDGATETLEEQSFEFSLTLTDGSASSTVADATSAGSWSLNGAQAYVPYMPYGAGLSQIIYVSNKGSQAGSIEVNAFDDQGNRYPEEGVYELGEVAASSIHKLTGDLEDALAADGFTSGKLAFTITVTAPKSQIEVYTGYNAGNDRGLVINSTNK